MAVTRITATKNGNAAIRYALTEQQQNKTKGVERVLLASGLNVDPAHAESQMSATREAFGKDGGSHVQAYRLIQSFGLDELNPDNPEDIEMANRLGYELALELYPDKEVVIVTQADGDGGMLHNHIVVNAVGFIDGKSIRAERRDWNHISKVNDAVIERAGLKPLARSGVENRSTMAERKLDAKGEYVWKGDLKARIEDAAAMIESKDSFIERMRDEHQVDVRFRGKKGVSYAFTDDEGKQRVARGKTLGTDFQLESLEERFEANRKARLEAEAAKPKQMAFDLEAALADIGLAPKKRVEKPVQRAAESKAEPPELDIDSILGDFALTPEQKRKSEELKEREAKEEAERRAEQERAEQIRQQMETQRELERQAEAARLAEEKRQEDAEKARVARERQERAEAEEAARRYCEAMRKRLDAVTPKGAADKLSQTAYLERFMALEPELQGKPMPKLVSTMADEPYTDADIARKARSELFDEKRAERTHQQVIQSDTGLERD